MIGLKFILVSSTFLAFPSLTTAEDKYLTTPTYATVTAPPVGLSLAGYNRLQAKAHSSGGKKNKKKPNKIGKKTAKDKKTEKKRKFKWKRVRVKTRVVVKTRARGKPKKSVKKYPTKENAVKKMAVKKAKDNGEEKSVAAADAQPISDAETAEDAYLKSDANSAGSRPVFSMFCVLALGVTQLLH